MNLIIASTGLALGTLGFAQTLLSRYFQKETRRYFAVIFALVDLYAASILLRELARPHAGYGWALMSRSTLFLQAFVSSILPITVGLFLLHQGGEPRAFRTSALWKASFLIWLLYLLLLISNLFSGLIYVVDDQNLYTRGKLFPILMIPPVLIMLINLLLLGRHREKLSKNQRTAFLIYNIIPLVSIVLQLLVRGVMLIVAGTVIAALFMFFYIVTDQQEIYYRQKLENERLRTDVLLAQIHPHFLFNALNTIRYLCREDPERADQAFGSFTAYLRDHMDRIAIDSPIPFEDELKLTEEYLSLQKLRFGEDLQVNYDFQDKDFRLPSLTLQPVVENAVIHGIRKSKSGCGTVTISTRRFFDHVELIVSDDGDGFSTEKADAAETKSHIGIENVRERLAMISKGEFLIETNPAHGTKVVMRIPVSELQE